MQKSILAVLLALFASNFSAAQKTATESANAHLPGTAINAMQKIDPLRIRAARALFVARFAGGTRHRTAWWRYCRQNTWPRSSL